MCARHSGEETGAVARARRTAARSPSHAAAFARGLHLIFQIVKELFATILWWGGLLHRAKGARLAAFGRQKEVQRFATHSAG